jgi:uncharacterized protein YpuA (DUF1002 family)
MTNYTDHIESLRKEIKEAIHNIMTQSKVNYVSFVDNPYNTLNVLWVERQCPEQSCFVEVRSLELDNDKFVLELHNYALHETWEVNENDYIFHDIDTLNALYNALQGILG